MTVARAYAPGHVSGLFAVHDDSPDLLRKGSRGAGWSIDKGAWAEVQETDETVFLVNGHPDDAPVTKYALDLLCPGRPLAVDIRLDLPVGQGFGMSASGTLAACLAAANLHGIEPEKALEAAHQAEVWSGTGLGDAVASWFGGGELRLKPGCPPHGWAMQIAVPQGTQFLYCVLGDAIPTSQIILDDHWKEETRRHGDDAVDRILEAGRERAWETLLVEAVGFGRHLGLMPARMLALSQHFPQEVKWGQCMLGSTLWITGDAGDLERCAAVLEGHGPTFRAGIDAHGARIVRSIPPLTIA